MGELANLLNDLERGQSNLPDEASTVTQLQAQGKGRFYCWKRRQHPEKPVPTMVAADASEAAEWFIDNIQASTPWPAWVKQEDGKYGPPNLIPETRVCIDSENGEYLVGEVDWLDSDDMQHKDLWAWFGPDEKAAFQRLWKSMKQGPNREWF